MHAQPKVSVARLGQVAIISNHSELSIEGDQVEHIIKD